MTGMVANLLLNIIIVCLLAATISYCWVLNRRIKILQDSKSELAQLLAHFDESTQRASESIIALQSASKRIGENIQHRIEKANYLIDDMGFLIERGNKLSNQLEASFAVNRARTRVMSEDDEKPADKAVNEDVQRQTDTVDKPANSKAKTVASLEAVLERVVGKKTAAPVEGPAKEPPTTHGRSKSEQELLDMLKAGVNG